MGELPVSVVSIQESIAAWAEDFSDFADGKDVKTWKKKALKIYAPVLVTGQNLGSIRTLALTKPEDQVTLSFPAFFDEDPPPETPTDPKVRFGGKARWGIMAFTREKAMFAFESMGRACLAGSIPFERIKAFNPLDFKFSMLSMTSAGPGYELFYAEPDGEIQRTVFRLALLPKHAADYESRLRIAFGSAGG